MAGGRPDQDAFTKVGLPLLRVKNCAVRNRAFVESSATCHQRAAKHAGLQGASPRIKMAAFPFNKGGGASDSGRGAPGGCGPGLRKLQHNPLKASPSFPFDKGECFTAPFLSLKGEIDEKTT